MRLRIELVSEGHAPAARIGEFYGLYGMVGRFSNITGPAIWALVTYLTIDRLGLQPRVGQGIGVLVLLMLVILSYVILQPVSDQPRVWEGADAVEREVGSPRSAA